MSTTPDTSELMDLKPRLVVIGVGGAGCNAVNNMIAADLTGVEYVVANTDAQALAASSAEHRIQLGAKLTEGLGAGSKPEIGQAAAEEAIDLIRDQIAGAHMVFIAAGMGGGTGTGAASIIADIAREQGILTVGVVTKPFQFEGARRMRIAEAGISELKDKVDTLIVIPNQNLFRLANEKTTFSEAFILADQVLYSGVACIVDLIIKEGLINLDFADVRTVISGMGSAMMGTGEADGERRAILAAEEAISNPLLDDVSLEGARGLLLSITGGSDLTLYEVDEAASRVREEVDPDANIIVGATFDESLGERVRVSIVASGMNKMADVGSPHTDAPKTAFPPFAPPEDTRTDMTGGVTISDFDTTPVSSPVVHAEHTDASQSDRALLQGDPAMPSEALHTRLSQALQSSAAGREASHEVHTEPDPWTSESEAPPPVPPPADVTWDSAGAVTIEDGLPPIASPFSESSQQIGYGDVDPATPDFVAATTEAMPRTVRRMPDLEDFPAHAQREYLDKQTSPQGDAGPLSGGRDHSDTRGGKRTLLDRLRRRARGRSDSLVEKPSSDSQQAPRPETRENESFSQSHVSVGDAHEEPAVERHQSADLPMFFGRMAR